ncbi:hypothetical protein N9L85_04505 [Euryarchaeota archaeon]|nr:hypothetical protein [Euryarchaeota archaeon]MDC3236696.1 hypothetical protein [Candidatus Poseidoniaceae archaeon]
MLEEVQTALLIGLLVSSYYLTVGCKNISESLPHESTHITDKVDGATAKISGMTEVLDDIANLLNEGLGALAGSGITHTPSNPVEMILNSLMTRMTSPSEHGPKQEEWQVRQDDSPPTLETENQLD